jgi:hypothetical protein
MKKRESRSQRTHAECEGRIKSPSVFGEKSTARGLYLLIALEQKACPCPPLNAREIFCVAFSLKIMLAGKLFMRDGACPALFGVENYLKDEAA